MTFKTTREIPIILKVMAIAGALLFMALNMAGAVWAGATLGVRLFLLPVQGLPGVDFGVLFFVGLGVAALTMKLVSGFAISALWRENQRGMAIVAMMSWITCLAYGWSAGIVSLILSPDLFSLNRVDIAVLAMAWLFVELMTALLSLVAANLMTLPGERENAGRVKPEPVIVLDTGSNGCVERFVDECMVEESGNTVRAKALYDAYCAWCQAHNWLPVAYTQFGKTLTAMGLGKGKTGGNIVYRHVTLSHTSGRPREGGHSSSLPETVRSSDTKMRTWRKAA